MSKHGIIVELECAPDSRRFNFAKSPDRSFAVNAQTTEDGKRIAEMLLYDLIGQDWYGDGLTAKRFEQELSAIGEIDEIHVLINSPGGSIIEALGIFNALARHKASVTTNNVGAAWSAASWILQAGDQRQASENSTTMIHNGQNIAMGDRRDFLKESEILEKLDSSMANIYAKRSGRKVDTFRKMMDDETWFNADEALSNKLIDTIIPTKSSVKNLDPASYGFNRKPVSVGADEMNERDIEAVRNRLRVLQLDEVA